MQKSEKIKNVVLRFIPAVRSSESFIKNLQESDQHTLDQFIPLSNTNTLNHQCISHAGGVGFVIGPEQNSHNRI